MDSPAATSEEEPRYSPDTIVSSPSEDSYPVDTYADRLMDDLFGEVEHILDSGVVPPELEEQVEVVSIRSLKMPPVALPSALVPRLDAYSPQDGAIQPFVPSTTATDDPPVLSPLFDRLLLGAVVVSCGITLAWWAIDRDRYAGLLSSASPQVVAPSLAVAANTADAEFIQYLQRSLENLKKQETAVAVSPATSAIPGTLESPAQLPTISIPGSPSIGDLSNLSPASTTTPLAVNPAFNPNSNQTVLERVYIPVYPNTPGSTQPQSIAAGSLPGIRNPAPPLLAAGGTGNLPSVPVAAPVAPLAASPAKLPANATNTQTSGIAPVTAPVATVTHSLVGILELGDRSAALFQVNGVTRRVNLGESIGSAGWMLVDVSNKEAIIRRNGEVRSIYIGQTF
jgi:hypothetical protein